MNYISNLVKVNKDPGHGSHITPIYMTSTFVFDNAEIGAKRFAGEDPGFMYSRLGNPNVRELEEKVAGLEYGEGCLAFSSGMAAITGCLLGILQAGDHVVAHTALYGATHAFLSQTVKKFGIDVTFVPFQSGEELEPHMTERTKVIYFETPSNPTLSLVDMTSVAAVAKQKGVLTVVDNTFLSPYLQNPIRCGIDVVVHSATKYLSGHGYLIGGLVISSKKIIDPMRKEVQKTMGANLAPMDAWLLNQGIRTLHIRMDRSQENARILAERLENHKAIERVYFPGLESFEDKRIMEKQMRGPGAMISFVLKDGYKAGVTLMNSVKLCTLAVSLGDVGTLIQHPASMTHAIIPKEEREKAGIDDGLVRFSVGIEDVEDIWEDLETAFG
ncbi:trans-sulfuration enzyme family protein [Brevibacillus choshinensis]|uniref:Aminotransferase class I/II-fold pyridoxal phosphate-dependent enzyme n=1 Tax=Brevibacillus choshinensis TaxID=54911 RepID=A0ABX7FT52_BRECH|nr:aminotransferase class I/II-fold pyridoxal phosphate-dependent enzyme [Brevibacillus choshinensis]QRG68985.1 aminotransferase class I/II-fold pyridoxal phosphate-dependent enzyme [Brevibacillus choshinensis]